MNTRKDKKCADYMFEAFDVTPDPDELRKKNKAPEEKGSVTMREQSISQSAKSQSANTYGIFQNRSFLFDSPTD